MISESEFFAKNLTLTLKIEVTDRDPLIIESETLCTCSNLFTKECECLKVLFSSVQSAEEDMINKQVFKILKERGLLKEVEHVEGVS